MASEIKMNRATAKKLLDSLQTDLRNLSSESKRKHPEVKDAAEVVQLKLRSISSKHEANIIAGLVPASVEIIRPFVLGCYTKNIRLIPSCLSCVQRLISCEAISTSAAEQIVDMLWSLMESSLEEVKLLQTATLLLTTNSVVQHNALARALVLCFRLHFTKDSTTVNTAAATVKQLVSAILDRVIEEDRMNKSEQTDTMDVKEFRTSSQTAPQSLRPFARDAYLLFQHPEFTFMLKDKLSPLVIKLFSPSLKYRQAAPLPPSSSSSSRTTSLEKPFFPVVVRLLRIVGILIQSFHSILVTECEIFLSVLVKFLESEKPMWQRCLALEVLYRVVLQPELIKNFCKNYDMRQHSTMIFQDIANAIAAFLQSQFVVKPGLPPPTGSKMPDSQGTSPTIVGRLAGGTTPQAAFLYHNVWIPLVIPLQSSHWRSVFLDMSDKVEQPQIPDGYGVSIAVHCLLEMMNSVRIIIIGEDNSGGVEESNAPLKGTQPLQGSLAPKDDDRRLHEQLINSSWYGMLAALSLLLDASTDEAITEAILKCQNSCTEMCGMLGLTVARDAFVTSLCKASLPPHYTLTIINVHSPVNADSKANSFTLNAEPQSMNNSPDKSQVVAVGTALPTATLTSAAQHAPVMLTSKNIHCMRALLNLAHCHGNVLEDAWHLVLTTLQHLVWILGLKPSSGGTLKASQPIVDLSNPVVTISALADLPVLSSMLSRLFESSQYLNNDSLCHLIEALCKLSKESMTLALSNREPSLFAVAKLLETGLVNLSRFDVLWQPVTSHLLEVCIHPHDALRSWGAEAITSLVKAVFSKKCDNALHLNEEICIRTLAPLRELSAIPQGDIRQLQLDCVLHVLHGFGENLRHGWPIVLRVIGSLNDQQGEKLIQFAFQCLQLVVTDYLPSISGTHLEQVIRVTTKFGLQPQELNVSLTAVGLLWNISDNLFQNRQQIERDLENGVQQQRTLTGTEGCLPLYDALWICLFLNLTELCVDLRPAVRKSAGQTLFSTVSAHGPLLQQDTWNAVLWKVLFPFLENVKKLSANASTSKDEPLASNILIHHSRDTTEKQWAETKVLSLAGIARIFSSMRCVLSHLDEFSRAWSLLLEYIESAAVCHNAEISLAAVKSFQEILLTRQESKDRPEKIGLPHTMLPPPDMEQMNRSEVVSSTTASEVNSLSNSHMWSTAWKVWVNIGTPTTKPPDKKVSLADDTIYVPSQKFLTALLNAFPGLFAHIKKRQVEAKCEKSMLDIPALCKHSLDLYSRFVTTDLHQFFRIVMSALSAPAHADSYPFLIASSSEASMTPLQEAALRSIHTLIEAVRSGSPTMQSMLPDIFEHLLTCCVFSVKSPKYGDLHTKASVFAASSKADWLTMNFVTFSERVQDVVVGLYSETCSHPVVIRSRVLRRVIETWRLPLSLKYDCPHPVTWKHSVTTLTSVLSAGLPVAIRHPADFEDMWAELIQLFEDFLFTNRSSHLLLLSVEEFMQDEAVDCKVIRLICDDILPYSRAVPRTFLLRTVDLLNRGSIHSVSSDMFVDTASSHKLREEFAKTCFETLLTYSFVGGQAEDTSFLSKLAVISFLRRCQYVIRKYVDDERLSGKCPLPRPRLTEINAALKAVSTLLQSLKKAPVTCVEADIWQEVIHLYPTLVECTMTTSRSVTCTVKDALHEYHDLLSSPGGSPVNG